MKTPEIVEKLSKKFPSPQYAFLTQVRNGTGYAREQVRTADAMVMGLWPSRGIHLTGFEVKVGRGDWLREYHSPEKAEEMVKYCDYWYIVAPDETVVKLDEIPTNWGLMLATGKGRSIKVIKEAPTLEPVPLDRLFLAGICRNITDGVVPSDIVAAKVAAAFEDGKQHNITVAEGAERREQEVKEAIEKFEKASGVSFSDWRAGDIGAAVKEVMEGRHTEVKDQLRRLAKTAHNIGKYADGEIDRWGING